MIRRANNFSSQYDMHFNTPKSEFGIFTADRKFNSAKIIECNGTSIKAQCVAVHLGNLVCRIKQGCGKMHTEFKKIPEYSNAPIAYFGVRR